MLADGPSAQGNATIGLDVSIVRESKACAPHGYGSKHRCKPIKADDLEELTDGAVSQSFELQTSARETIQFFRLNEHLIAALSAMNHGATNLKDRFSVVFVFHLRGAFNSVRFTRLVSCHAYNVG